MHVPAPGSVQMFAVLSIWYVDFAEFIKGGWKAPFLCWLFYVYLSSHALPANLFHFAIRISSGWVNVNVLMAPLVEISPQMGKAYCREKPAVCDVDRQTVQLCRDSQPERFRCWERQGGVWQQGLRQGQALAIGQRWLWFDPNKCAKPQAGQWEWQHSERYLREIIS